MLRTRLRLAAGLLAALMFAAGSGIAYMRLAPRQVPPGQAPLVNLTGGSLGPFMEAFNSEPSSTRVVLILSPT